MQQKPENNDALVGYNGFVGSTLLGQQPFHSRFNSKNIEEIDNRGFDTVVCSAAPAQKWIANREPDVDRANIEQLITHLGTVDCERFVLISTVDVFKTPAGVTEETRVDEDGLHAYGLHRRLLEKFVADRFPRHLIVRLPGLVGPGLRKNVLYDFLHGNELHKIDSRAVMQFYPMVNFWYDIQTAIHAGLSLLHLTAAPISVAETAQQGFNREFTQHAGDSPTAYDMRTRHAGLFGGSGAYQYSQRESIQAIRAYAQSERRGVAA